MARFCLFCFFVVFFKPLTKLFVDGLGDLDQATLHPVEVLVKSSPENLVDGDEAEVGEKPAGKAFRFYFVLEIASIDSGDLVD